VQSDGSTDKFKQATGDVV
jgi:hypothetical protein